jgi:hypothetical protein
VGNLYCAVVRKSNSYANEPIRAISALYNDRYEKQSVILYYQEEIFACLYIRFTKKVQGERRLSSFLEDREGNFPAFYRFAAIKRVR